MVVLCEGIGGGVENKTAATVVKKGKVKAVPFQARSCPECSRKLRFPDFVTLSQDAGKVVSLTHLPPLPPGNTPGTRFCYEAESTPGS